MTKGTVSLTPLLFFLFFFFFLFFLHSTGPSAVHSVSVPTYLYTTYETGEAGLHVL